MPDSNEAGDVAGRPPAPGRVVLSGQVRPFERGKFLHIDPEISSCSIVLVGKLNPAIFHPAWLIAHDVERGVSVEDATTEIVHQDVSKFSVGTRTYFVDKFRFQIQTTEAPWVLLSDTTAQIFGELLTHTPLEAFGINRDVHFNVKDAETRKRIGRMLAPIEPWGAFGADMDKEYETLGGGLSSLTMRRSSEEKIYYLQKNVKIEPSAQTHAGTGVYLQINFHHVLKNLDDSHGALPVVSILTDVFQSRMAESEAILDSIMRIG